MIITIMQAMQEEHAKQRHVWASTKKTLQAQQSSLQDECNDLACQLAERDQQLRCRDERIMQLKKQLQEADLTVISRRGSEVQMQNVLLCPAVTRLVVHGYICLPACLSVCLPVCLHASLPAACLPVRYNTHCCTKPCMHMTSANHDLMRKLGSAKAPPRESQCLMHAVVGIEVSHTAGCGFGH